VLIKILFVLLVLGVAGAVASCLGMLWRVRRHMHQERINARVQETIEQAHQTADEPAAS
jgi:cytochrome oxidase assembly protein ShyY1